MATFKADDLVGAELDRLALLEIRALRGKWIAMEVYDRATQPTRRIAAVGNSPADCIRQLIANGSDPGQFEFRMR